VQSVGEGAVEDGVEVGEDICPEDFYDDGAGDGGWDRDGC